MTLLHLLQILGAGAAALIAAFAVAGLVALHQYVQDKITSHAQGE